MGAMRSILVVDDTDELRETLVDALSFQGFAVSSARNGREAVDWLRAHGETPWLVLLDLMMPVMDGPAFLALRSRDPMLARVPVIVMTAADDCEKLVPAQDVCRFLPKTAPLSELYAAISAFA